VPFSLERVFFLLRWMVIGLALAIMLYASNSVTEVVRAVQLAALVGIYNGMVSGMRSLFPDHTTRIWLAILDAFIIGLVVWLGGGVKSPWLVFFYVLIAEASLVFSPSNVLSYTALVSIIYVVAALFVPGEKWSELNITIIMSEILVMFIVSSISTALVRAMDHQRRLVRRERALAAQLNHQIKALSALNRLSEQLNASLEIDQLMQNTVQVLPEALEVDACIALLAQRPEQAKWNLGSVWCGLDEAFELAESDTNLLSEEVGEAGRLIQAGPLILSEAAWDSILGHGETLCLPPATSFSENESSSEAPLASPSSDLNEESNKLVELAVLVVPLKPSENEVGALGLIRQNGASFSQNDQELLAALGRQLSLLIRNARLYEMERNSVARLQDLEQAKSDFLSVVSHELRTPLTSIKASTILLLSNQNQNPENTNKASTEANEAAQTLLKNVDRNVDRLDGLVTDLLDMAKLQNGRLRLSLQPVNFAEVVADVVASLRPLFNNKQQQLELNLPQTVISITADRRRLEQIVTNLLSNAHRYTPRHGTIQAEVVYKLKETSPHLLLTVADCGPGIDSAEHERIFEKFYRAGNSKGGTGLGLTIARSLTELHGGKVWVESNLPHGSTFCLQLPLNFLYQ
jgi:signal transduction histidine kinase